MCILLVGTQNQGRMAAEERGVSENLCVVILLVTFCLWAPI